MSYREYKKKKRSETLIIKKYKNRKYYCMFRKKFVDLNYITELIKRKEEFIVLDSENVDITVEVVKKLFRRELREHDKQKTKKEIV